MEIIIRPRRYGKTTELIKLASEEKYGVIVCHSAIEASRIYEMALGMRGKKEIENLIPMPITYREFLDREYYGKIISKFFIDNVDMLLQNISTIEIGAITLTNNIENVKKNIIKYKIQVLI